MREITKSELRKRLGNISQLQELLFGEQIEQYNYRLEQQDRRLKQLEANSNKFQLNIEEQIERLEDRLLHRIDGIANSLEKKITYLNFTAQEKHREFKHELDTLSKHSYENIDYLQNSLNTNTNNLKAEIDRTKSTIDRDLQQLKQQISEKLASNLDKLAANKVSRTDLAEVLFELCLKLKDTDVDLELPEEELASESHQNNSHGSNSQGDLVLPETVSIEQES